MTQSNKMRIAITLTFIVVAVSAFVWFSSSGTPVSEPKDLPTATSTTRWEPAPKNNVPSRPKTQPNTEQSDEENSANTSKPNNESSRPTEKPKDENTLITADGRQYPLRTYKPLAIPNDPGADQWWVTHTGLDTAWGYPAGSYETTVAVIDTGFALNHEEFQGRWQSNAGEQGSTTQEAPSKLNCSDQNKALDKSCNRIDDDFDGVVDNETGSTTKENPSDLNCTDQNKTLDKSCNNVDDDGNGLADDVRGWDFASFDDSVQTGQTNPDGSGTQHGTMVSGVLAATGDNGVGVAGVNWRTKILPVQALDDDSYGNTLTVARAIRYAAQQGADVISVSIGTNAEDPYLREAVHYALERDSIVVAASGNDGCDCITYPARYPEVVAVGAFNNNNAPASFSSYGSNLDLLAPGVDMTAPSWSKDYTTNGYATGSGTSFAAPYTSGLLALARSHQPNATWGEITATLREEANHVTLTTSNPHSSTLGFGYAQADTLLARATTPVVTEWRHQFGPLEQTDTLATARSFQCREGGFPTTPLYTLKNGDKIRYTASKFELYKAEQSGWVGERLTYTCAGLPGDDISSLRIINLINEIHNKPFQKL